MRSNPGRRAKFRGRPEASRHPSRANLALVGIGIHECDGNPHLPQFVRRGQTCRIRYNYQHLMQTLFGALLHATSFSPDSFFRRLFKTASPYS